jgi:predicted P-loop ATPase
MRRMTDFLQRRFRLRRNSITGSAEYIEEGKYMFDWKPLTKEVINSMAIDAIDEGIAIWDKDIRRYLESTYVYEYDPIADYLDALPEWDGHDRVSELARRLPTGNAVWEKNFHTWMLALVAQWTGKNDMHGNTMVPLLIGKQGDAKSTFCRLLLPEELREYYTDRIDFTNRNDAERALSRYALINIDEFDSITKRQVAFLKHILQKTSIMNRKLYQSVIASQKRYSSFIATTNDPAPLTDPTGSRRYMCVRTSGVIDTETPIEYPQVYAQLRQELKEGKKCYFDREEESEIQRANEAFQDFDVLPDIFAHCYRKPKPDEKGIYMGVSQILHQLRKTSLAVKEDRPTLSKLGKMLRQNEYSFKHTNVGNMYEVMVKLPV